MLHRKRKETKHGAWPICTWLLLNFFPFPVGHPPNPPCSTEFSTNGRRHATLLKLELESEMGRGTCFDFVRVLMVVWAGKAALLRCLCVNGGCTTLSVMETLRLSLASSEQNVEKNPPHARGGGNDGDTKRSQTCCSLAPSLP